MIRYQVTEADLTRLVNELDPNWLTDAETRTEKFRLAGFYKEPSTNWSAIKDVYLKLQRNKCIFCERVLAAPGAGRIEHDVEHFRPKSEVKAWPTPKIIKERNLNYRFSTGDPMPNGYYLLAYRLLNYATSCKTCNSSFKSSYFPIAGVRGALSDKPADFKTEKPFIPYPLGTFDDDPESIITFAGILPIPKAKTKSSRRYRRAQITIDFFRLDQREELLDERAKIVDTLWICLETERTGSQESLRARARELIDFLVSEFSNHTSCARSFVALYHADRDRAERYSLEAHLYLMSKIR